MAKQKKPRKSVTKYVEFLRIKEQLIEEITNSTNDEEKEMLTSELEKVQSQIDKIKKINLTKPAETWGEKEWEKFNMKVENKKNENQL